MPDNDVDSKYFFNRLEGNLNSYVSFYKRKDQVSIGLLHARQITPIIGNLCFSRFIPSSEEELIELGYIDRIDLADYYKQIRVPQDYIDAIQLDIPEEFRKVYRVTAQGDEMVKLKQIDGLGEKAKGFSLKSAYQLR